MVMATVASIESKPALLLGECVIYLGVFNYFLTANESTPVVSRIGTVVGQLDLRITPFVAVLQRSGAKTEEEFVPYERVDMDSEEEQLHDLLDRTLQYRVQLRGLRWLAPRQFTRVSLRYTFFRETSTQTPKLCVAEHGDAGPLDLEYRHVVDVNDAFVKYIADSTLMIEVLGHIE